ncbi:hypothetical protein CDL15_Pgr022172 [Punica granatum]|uniref:Uncharacterized protein n=1 Tax=Punica granatum TaxID=22663 RepID=A0A218VSA1_PUNGR|nr:hypothetical protein CDL15_Pgr022172 [Punica granatum]PKI70731.1 hypothetical protein CRG98_008964 [Punica granatum]
MQLQSRRGCCMGWGGGLVVVAAREIELGLSGLGGDAATGRGEPTRRSTAGGRRDRETKKRETICETEYERRERRGKTEN